MGNKLLFSSVRRRDVYSVELEAVTADGSAKCGDVRLCPDLSQSQLNEYLSE
jgi:hypothetical protein